VSGCSIQTDCAVGSTPASTEDKLMLQSEIRSPPFGTICIIATKMKADIETEQSTPSRQAFKVSKAMFLNYKI
jgi:hypothetical protein